MMYWKGVRTDLNTDIVALYRFVPKNTFYIEIPTYPKNREIKGKANGVRFRHDRKLTTHCPAGDVLRT